MCAGKPQSQSTDVGLSTVLRVGGVEGVLHKRGSREAVSPRAGYGEHAAASGRTGSSLATSAAALGAVVLPAGLKPGSLVVPAGLCINQDLFTVLTNV